MAFLTLYRSYKWIMLMGLANALAIFIWMINNLFMDMVDKRVVVSLDDVCIYSNTVKKYFELLKKVFTQLRKHVFYWKLKKCSFL